MGRAEKDSKGRKTQEAVYGTGDSETDEHSEARPPSPKPTAKFSRPRSTLSSGH